MEDFARQHSGFLLVVLNGTICVLVWFILRTVQNTDKKLELLWVSLFGDGQDTEGILTRLRILEHDHNRNHTAGTAGLHHREGDCEETLHIREPAGR